MILGILGTGKEIILHMDYIGQGCGIIPYRRYIGNSADIDAAVAHKHTNAGCHTGKIPLRGQLSGPGEAPALIRQGLGCHGCRCRCFQYRHGNILGLLECAANKHSLSCGIHRSQVGCFGKHMAVQFNAHGFGQLNGIGTGGKPYGQYHHVKNLFCC